MACAKCPYQNTYQLIWRDEGDPELIAVLLHCCSGPELQVRRGAERLLCELHTTREAVLTRAEELRGKPLGVFLPSH